MKRGAAEARLLAESKNFWGTSAFYQDLSAVLELAGPYLFIRVQFRFVEP